MADKQPEEKDGLIELIKKIGSPILGIIGAVTSLFNFYQLWSGNQATIIYIFAGGGFLLLLIALGWIGFSKKDVPKRGNRKSLRSIPRYSLLFRRIAWSSLTILALLAVVAVYFLVQHRTEQENKLIVLITAFEGPEDVYGLKNEIIENLNADFSEDEKIEIISIDEIITVSKGSEYARKLGKNHLADIVIWGWYRPTENPNINIHIENLSPNQLLTLQESESFQPVTTKSELESFSFQQQAGSETSTLISFLAGLIEFQSGDFENAIKYFDYSLVNLPASVLLFENKLEIYLYRAFANIFLERYVDVIQDFDKVIQINPQDTTAYHNRGFAYFILGEYERAIQDYNQAIKINPQNANTFSSRGVAYLILSEYERAIQDFDKAIQIDPKFTEAYINRGSAYDNLGKYERAIQDFDKAIQINPQLPDAYYNRGIAYGFLGEYERAVQDFDKTIQIDPKYFNAYYGRGLAYRALGKTDEAEADFAKYKELTGQDTP
ncbi:MAG: tetratricopeptide repeat protein [Anaerolineales bacterium]|nr:tetratricopeptide repeat protein [Anaerolineales bacterium]